MLEMEFRITDVLAVDGAVSGRVFVLISASAVKNSMGGVRRAACNDVMRRACLE